MKNQIENVFQGDIKMNEKYHNIKLFEQLFFNYIIDTDERDVFRLYYSLQERILALYSRYKLKINIAFFCNDLESLKKNITSLRALENKIICKMNFFEFYNLVQNNDNFLVSFFSNIESELIIFENESKNDSILSADNKLSYFISNFDPKYLFIANLKNEIRTMEDIIKGFEEGF